MSYSPDNAQLVNALQNVMVISTTDLQGNITYANDLFCTLTGFAREEAAADAPYRALTTIDDVFPDRPR